MLSACVDRAPFPSEALPPNVDQVKWVLVSPAAATISTSQSVRLEAQFQDEQFQSISSEIHWSSSDTTVATVSDSGVVRGRKAGVVRISVASASAGAYAKVQVTPTPPPAIRVKVSPSSVTLTVPATVQLTSSVTFTSGTNVPDATVTWLSSNTAVATVTQSGLVTAISAGGAKVTARNSTSSASVTITVKNKPPESSQPTSPTQPTQPTQPPAPAPPVGSLFSGYSTVSPHWQHIRIALTDFYDPNGWTSTERAWDGQHYDLVMGGNATAWHAVNPGIRHYQYVLLQATTIPTATPPTSAVSQWYSDAVAWYAAHPEYRMETAFLHQVGQPADSAHRLKPWGWDTYTWIINPSDPGLVAYQSDRFRRLSANEDGLFIDSQGSGSLGGNLKDRTSPLGSLEYPNSAGAWPPSGQYFVDYAALLRALKAAVGSKTLQPNTSGYDFDPDFADVTAAGATHMEKVNYPLSSNLANSWTWIDKLLGAGVDVNMVDALDYEDMNAVISKYFGGTLDSAYH
ncbi:MAG: Ig-like domain-containing protein, partial [Gemmatimonadaceae bacterium]